MSDRELPTPPSAPIHPVVRSHHGRDFTDNYEWLRAKDDPETLAYVAAENAYTEAMTAPLAELSENIYHEIRSRVKETDMSVPTRSGQWWYYSRIVAGDSYGYTCRLPLLEGADPWLPPEIPEAGAPAGEEILLNLNELAEGHEFFALGTASVTDSGRLLAYSVDTTGDERFDLRIKDLHTGQLLDDHLSGIFYGATWAGEEYLFYQTVDEAWRPNAVWRHRLGTPQSEDVQVYVEEDERFNVGIGSTRSRTYLIIDVASQVTSETWVLPIAKPEGEFQRLWERETGVEYSVDHAIVGGADHWVVTHNATGENFALGETPAHLGADLPPLRTLPELIAHSEQRRIEGVDTYRDFLVVGYREGGIGRAGVMTLSAAGFSELREITFDEELYTVGVGGNPEWDAPVIRLTYGSFITPTQLLDYEVATGKRTLLKQQEVLGGYDPTQYTAYRLWVTARDGVQIPVSVIRRVDTDDTEPNPTLLYGYGAYESSRDPSFSVARLSMLDRGMLFVIAHVRGGGELGRAWYEQGKLLKKKNTFNDFIDVADYLIAEGLTTPKLLVGEGGSAGGLLIGAVANQAPDRFVALQAAVPFVDPLTSILMPELPLTVIEWDEWGDPLHDPEAYDYIASYSPYENVKAQSYPNILALTSLNDTRVLYVEPAKWIAKLRATATSGTFLLKTEMNAGHGGVSGRYARWRQTAFEFAWSIHQATGLLR